MKHYIADCHFGDDKARVMDKRPFDSVEQMNETMIDRWNDTVKRNRDEIYIIGDFCVGKAEETMDILRRLKGKKYLITGNHDMKFLHDKKLDGTLFEWIKPYAEIRDNNRKVVLSHYPIICYNGQYYGNMSYMLYGHVHNTRDYNNVKRFVRESRKTVYGDDNLNLPCNLINCFADFSDYRPMTLDMWINCEENRSCKV